MNESVAGRSERDELSPLRPRWEWSADEIKRIGRVVGLIAEHLTTLPENLCFARFRWSWRRNTWTRSRRS